MMAEQLSIFDVIDEDQVISTKHKKDQGALNNAATQNMSDKILSLLNKGFHLSELDGLHYGYGTSFRTRISELRKQGHKIKDYFVDAPSGARFKKYHIEASK